MNANDSVLKEIPIEFLKPGKYQPRTQFDEQALHELAASIKQTGIIQPIFVRPVDKNRYEIIAGERRWRAAQIAGLDTVSCLVKTISDADAIAAATIENIQRQDLNPIEEGKAYHRMASDFNYTHEEIATIVGKSRPKISNLIRLLTLDSRAQSIIIEENLSEGHAKVIAGRHQYEQVSLAMKVVRHKWSVRQLENFIKNGIKDEAPTKPDPDILRLEQRLSEQLGVRVKFNLDSNNKSGWLSMYFNDNDILSGILDKIGVTLDEC